ncbi:MutS domain V [Singulisphaera sp. GP187]|uniref:MutS-related protein n=1 Tax=Singulisphaera sp. GP187 TaxID=1882752 RepID=UPI000928DBE3|nr:DNA mismatch repair protein MutS [Singulisphaera sp. GP187]SIN85448.1 MutS domain V [Singulisphaera sp. GP187]
MEDVESPSQEGVRLDYTRRLEGRRATRAQFTFRERVITEARLLVFIAGLVLAGVAFGAERISGAWVALPIFLFLLLILIHARLARLSHRAGRAVEFYEKGIARVENRWAGKGEPGHRFLDPEHPYAADLDLFGVGSMFERLCTARTRSGEDTLAAWLLKPATPEVVLERQAAVAELRAQVDLREDIELLGADVRAGIDPEALAAWGKTPRLFSSRLLRIGAGLLSALTVAALIAWELIDLGPAPFFVLVIIELLFAWKMSGSIHHVLAPLDRRAPELVLLSHLLERLERETFQAPALRRLQVQLQCEGVPASRQIAKLAQLLQLLDSQKNQLFLPFAAMLLWSFQLATLIDSWRAKSGPAIAGWLAAIGEFEALCALAAYAWENPTDVFPTIQAEGARFEALDLGHPLLAESVLVRNDVALGGDLQVLVVSGSNMSGKSTLLRSVGINTVLALAGSPVCARKLTLSPLAIGATLRVQDSLQAGRSRFYAEITRLRQLVDLSRGPIPLLFLIDEILNGTNSHDRSVGGESVIRGLIGRGAIGLVTTHDLALAEIADRLGTIAKNVHFVDHFENGTLHFDYLMRPGVVRKSNALALMRAVGLDV